MSHLEDRAVAEIQAAFAARALLYQRLDIQLAHAVSKLGRRIAAAFCSGRKLLTCGNGGSAAEAQHLAEELIGRFRSSRRPLPALALTSDGTALTCIANDFGYDDVFARQIAGLANEDDIVLMLSTSGNSGNLIAAARMARTVGAIPTALLGRDGGALAKLCDHTVVIPEQRSDLIQEAQLTVVHMLCALIERDLGLAGVEPL